MLINVSWWENLLLGIGSGSLIAAVLYLFLKKRFGKD
jgi:hypothetical protein